MIKRLSIQIFVTLLSLAVWFPAGVVCASEPYRGTCEVTFEGDSTLHAFTGHITNLALVVQVETNAVGVATLRTRLEIKPRQLTTHHKKRDANMYKMFLEDRFPSLVVAVSNAPLIAAKLVPNENAPGSGVLPLQLTICGTTRDVQAHTSHSQPVAEGWEFELDAEVSLKAFNLDPPSALLGAVSVKDTVKLNAHVKLLKPPPKS